MPQKLKPGFISQIRVYLLFFYLIISLQLLAGGGKEAFRNYYLGSYYFAEGVYGRAANHLEKAYNLDPQQYQFALAYALSLGQQGKTDDAITILNKGKNLLPVNHPSYKHLLSLQYFVSGMINVYGQRYGRALSPLKRAAELQTELAFPEERAVILNTLGYAQVMDQGKGTGRHGGLGKHFHVHKRDLERSLGYFRKAYQADVQNKAAAENYQLLMDTLGLEREQIVEDHVDRSAVKQIKTYKYDNLPANMQPLIEFTQYDEVVLLLDISGSMVMEQVSCIGSDRFDVMRETALLLLENFPDSTKVGIGTIGGDCGTVPRLWYPVGERSRYDLRYDLQFLVPDGTTPLFTILQKTPELFSNTSSKTKALIFISDGENVCRVPGIDICEWTSTLASQKITINIMTFLGASLENSNAFAEYTCLAENTFGQLLYMDGDRCQLSQYEFDLVKACQLSLPNLERVDCWGAAVEELWAIFPEE